MKEEKKRHIRYIHVFPSNVRTLNVFSRLINGYHAVLFTHTRTGADTIPCGSLPVQSLGPQQSDGGMTKKRRKRRRKARPEAVGGRREESGEEFSEDEDMFTIDLSSDEEREGEASRCVCTCVCTCVYPCPRAFVAILHRVCGKCYCVAVGEGPNIWWLFLSHWSGTLHVCAHST